jgi:hypothetical protein
MDVSFMALEPLWWNPVAGLERGGGYKLAQAVVSNP